MKLNKIEKLISEKLNLAVWLIYQNRKYKIQNISNGSILYEFDTKEKLENWILD